MPPRPPLRTQANAIRYFIMHAIGGLYLVSKQQQEWCCPRSSLPPNSGGGVSKAQSARQLGPPSTRAHPKHTTLASWRCCRTWMLSASAQWSPFWRMRRLSCRWALLG